MTSPAPGCEVASRIEAIPCGDDVCLSFPCGRRAAFRGRPARVDVLVPAFQAATNLERCVRSALQQTLPDVHVIVVDNASTDETFARACQLADADERVLVVQNARNLGRVPNWNRALDLATASYVKLLMANDLLLPAFAEELVAALDAAPDAVMARASLSIRAPDGNVRFLPYFAESTVLSRGRARLLSLARDNVAGSPSAQLLRRAVIARERVRFDESLGWAADYDFSTRLFEHGGLAYVKKALFVFDATASRFFAASNLVAQFRDECAVRVNGVERARDLDADAVAQTARGLAAVFAGYTQRASTPEAKAELGTIHANAQMRIVARRAASAATEDPAVSVVIPCYNQACFLPEAVESLVAQTYSDWECIIVNDGSPDDTVAVAEALARKYAPRRIRVITQPNRGLSEARNTGIRAARGRAILPFDSDDRLAPTMLERLVAVLDGDSGADIAFTHAQCFGVQTGVWRCGPFSIEHLKTANRIPYCSLYRRRVWEAVGGYNPNLDAFEDWDFWIGAAERGFRAKCAAMTRSSSIERRRRACSPRPRSEGRGCSRASPSTTRGCTTRRRSPPRAR